jgi:diguanylate cyclase
MTTDELIAGRWAALLDSASPQTQQLLKSLSEREGPAFIAAFYQEMTQDPQAGGFLAAEGLTVRLRESLRLWLDDLLSNWDPQRIPARIAAHRKTGEVHARIGVPVQLMLRGARVLKQKMLAALLRAEVTHDHFQAAQFVTEFIDLAMEVMADQYETSSAIEARGDEAYRNYAASMNMSVELERQRAALFSWKTDLLKAVLIGAPTDPLPFLASCPFGLWLRHKAASLFQNEPGFQEILHSLDCVDAHIELLQERRAPHAPSEEQRHRVALILDEARQIQALIESMFEHFISMESGRDTLTQLLSRRFQSTILTREIENTRNSGKGFAVMLLDIDHFKRVNDRHGHEAGDTVLRHVAEVFSANVRSGDFIFRHGGEEFMIVCVEVTETEASAIADKIRDAVQKNPVRLSENESLSVTISVGVAVYDGHPDYQRMITRADRALYHAKNTGRNRCAIAA